jgi:hypothetical protein
MAQWCTGSRFETMTARAISLTGRVRTPARTAATGITFPAYDLRVFLDGLGRLGYDADKLLAAGGLRDTDLSAPDARVSCDAVGAVLTRTQQERFTPNPALELARVTPLGVERVTVTINRQPGQLFKRDRCRQMYSAKSLPVGLTSLALLWTTARNGASCCLATVSHDGRSTTSGSSDMPKGFGDSAHVAYGVAAP